MEEKQKIEALTPFTFKINTISLLSFNVEPLDKGEAANVDFRKFAFQYNLEFKTDFDKKTVTVICYIGIYSEPNHKVLLGNLNVCGLFDVINMEEVKEAYNGIPNFASVNMMGIVVSTARGILLIKSEGTILNGATLPVMDLNKLIGTITPIKPPAP